MADFRINYRQVVGQANKINSLSGDLGREISRLEQMLGAMGTHWKGPASNEFKKHLRLLVADMKKTRSNMSNASSTMKDVADRIQKEDERQMELAAKLVQ